MVKGFQNRGMKEPEEQIEQTDKEVPLRPDLRGLEENFGVRRRRDEQEGGGRGGIG